MARARAAGLYDGRADEGIDVGAKYEIYELIIQMAKRANYNRRLLRDARDLGITNRIGVMSNGHLSGIVNTKETNQEELLRLSAKIPVREKMLMAAEITKILTAEQGAQLLQPIDEYVGATGEDKRPASERHGQGPGYRTASKPQARPHLYG